MGTLKDRAYVVPQLYAVFHNEGNRIFSAYFYRCFLNFLFFSMLHIFHKICCKM